MAYNVNVPFGMADLPTLPLHPTVNSTTKKGMNSSEGKEKPTPGSMSANSNPNNTPATSKEKEKEKEKEKDKDKETPHIYDFTKRKGWSGLLLSQLSGTIQFVFSPRGNVVFVSGCVREYLGWEAEEVVERNLVHLLHQDDIQPFFAHIHHAITTRSELAAYTRFRAKDDRTPLFEVRGHPYFMGLKEGEGASVGAGEEGSGTTGTGAAGGGAGTGTGGGEYAGYQCFFAMARPYPSKPAALLDSFLDLKIENEHLRQRLASLSSPTTSNNSTSRERPYNALYLEPGGVSAGVKRDEPPTGLEGERKRVKRTTNSSNPNPSNPNISTHTNTHSTADREKQKTYVCVMCGRTDSPEWRKGPLGAKTLCNACGLRWAKRNSRRKNEEPGVGEEEGTSSALPSTAPGGESVLFAPVPPAGGELGGAGAGAGQGVGVGEG
ncbi:hypothetical protein DACRYDRAFT_117132 [Dacryopinax primogenitus]|uniref:GATA-domain-containing protein n=1 Tax=Dacryopinax primogenitus (strain DJM 731) TaxID=1858805 RepID=M5GA25_DACPD|nr:uncharacterized protein DACRYDRAFT_117132 [Dacryopinax primogenitus]EJU00693.1 hypothetical protein DACRYDRAFT_117132 [Dacryopinax primogenitus]